MLASRTRLLPRLSLHTALLALVVLLALIVRVYGINFPRYHWDEQVLFGDVFFAFGNSLQMQTYEHGSFMTYILLSLWYPLVALTHRTLPGTFEYFLTYYQDPTWLSLSGRLISVLTSTGSVLCVYFLGRRLYGRVVGLIAAFFLAVTFLDVSESHYMRVYALTSFLALLAISFSIKILDERRTRNYMLAGLFIGLATAAQFTVVFLVVPLVTAHVIATRSRWGPAAWRHLFSKELLVGLDTAGLAFFLVTPYALVEFPAWAGFMKWFVLNRAHVTWVSPEGQPVWLFYLTEHLAGGMGVGLELVALLGFAYFLYRHRPHELILAEFPVMLFLTLNGGPNYARYALPLLPILCIAAANLLSDLSQWSRRWISPKLSLLAMTVVVLALAVPSLLSVVRFDFWMTQPDTRSLATQWIESNVPADASVAIEGLDILGPYVPPNRAIVDALSAQARTEFEHQDMRALQTSLQGRQGYQVTQLFRLDQDVRGGVVVASIPSAQFYADRGIDYIVTVNWMKRTADDQYRPEFQQSLDAFYKPVAHIRPTVMFRYDPYAWRTDYDALARVMPGQAQVGGPLLTIYERRALER